MAYADTKHRTLGAAQRCRTCNSIIAKNAAGVFLTGKEMVHERANWDWIA